jgi:hypothetical protein
MAKGEPAGDVGDGVLASQPFGFVWDISGLMVNAKPHNKIEASSKR